MKLDRVRRCILALPMAGLVATVFCATASAAPKKGITGTWAIAGRLVAGTPYNENDPWTPKEGSGKFETWRITRSGSALALTGSKGAVPGTQTGTGGKFHTVVPWSPGGGIRIDIDITINVFSAGKDAIRGTAQILYYGYNGIGMRNPVPSREAWTFKGKRKG